jgi:hypothetical protein
MGELCVPTHYVLSHFVTGFIGAYYPIIAILGLLYQLGQYYYGVRVFPLEGKIIKGNSPYITSVKITQLAVGYLIGALLKLRNKNK